MRVRAGFLLALALPSTASLLQIGAAQAEPYRPEDDASVLVTLPASLPERPPAAGDPARAAEEAQRFLELARTTGDPRFLGYAEGWLNPWMAAAAPPGDVLLMRATLRQARHDFTGALADLDRLLTLAPRNAQGWLTQATILRVQGRFAEAGMSCTRLDGLAPPFVATLCAESVRGCRGELAAAAQALEAMVPASTRAPRALRAWFVAERAEQAVRLGQPQEARRHYSRALIEGLGTPTLRADFADLLLDLGRPEDVFAIAGNSTNEMLNLRVAIAARRQGQPRADLEAALADFHAAARRRGEDGHAREEARFELEIRGDAVRAVVLARENWRHQREPADARLLLETARRARSPADVAAIRAWLRETGFEDARLAPLLADRSP